MRDYKGASAPPGAGWAEGGALQVALYMLAARELLGLEPVGGLYQALWARDSRPRGLVRDDVPGKLREHRRGRRAGARGGARRGPRARAGDRGGAAGRRGERVPGALLAERLRLPDDLPGGRMSDDVAFTDEQRAAIDDRAGSALLAANAGSGKTAVMAERCVEAVLRDGVPVGSILALTFTEKAAGELRERIRRRFLALGEEEQGARRRRRLDRDDPRLLRARAAQPAAGRGARPALRGARRGRGGAARARRLRARVRGVGGRARRAGGRRRRGVRQRPARASCSTPTRRCARAARRGRCCPSRRRRRRPTPRRSPPRARPPRATSRRRATGAGSRRRSTRWRPASACSARVDVPVPSALAAGGAQEGLEGARSRSRARPTARRGRRTARAAPTTTRGSR